MFCFDKNVCLLYMSEYTVVLKHYDVLNAIAIAFPIIVWTIIVGKYLLSEKIPFLFITLPIILFPYIIAIYNWYVVVIKSWGISLIPTYGFCFRTNVSPTMKEKGVVGVVDSACMTNNDIVVTEQAKLMVDRFYYINYIILFVLVIAYNNIKHVFKRKNEFLKMVAITTGLSVFGAVAGIFSHYLVYSIFIQRLIIGFLNTNIAMLILLLLYIFNRVYIK